MNQKELEIETITKQLEKGLNVQNLMLLKHRKGEIRKAEIRVPKSCGRG
jgi:hypothetical protein